MRGPEGEAGELGLSVKCTGLAIPEEYVFGGFVLNIYVPQNSLPKTL